MGDKTRIAWTDSTWNPVTGCSRISSGCKNCYAAKMHKRLSSMGSAKYDHEFGDVRCHEDEKLLSQPARWTKPRGIFVNSMSDLFHDDVPFEFIDKVYKSMMAGPQHTYQILTKRPLRMKEYLDSAPFDVPPYIHHGVTVEDEQNIWRINVLQKIACPVKFVSFEPLIGWVRSVGLTDIDQIIIGGESGPGARPMDEEWVRSLIFEASRYGSKVFVKQFGSAWARQKGLKGKGDCVRHWPEWAKRQEMI